MRRCIQTLAFASAICLGASLTAQWESWRGPRGDGVSTATDFPATWSPEGKNLLWSKEIGGRSTPVVHDGHVYTICRAGSGVTSQEQVVCFDAESGEILWQDQFNVFHTTIPGPRVGWASPCVDPATGNVYAHGVQGIFRCYDRDGKILWSRSLTEDNGRISGYGGRTHTPVVDGDLVILSFLNSGLGEQGPGRHRYVACDKLTGEIVWWSDPGGAPHDTTYSTPVVSVVNGIRTLFCPAADGAIYGLKVRTGEKLWGLPMSKRGFNVSPVVAGDRLYIAHSEENLDTIKKGTVACIDVSAKPGPDGQLPASAVVWRRDGLEVGYASPALHGGILYVVDNPGNLIALDADDGKTLWTHNLGTVGKGSPVWVDGKLYVGEVNGRFHVLEPSRAGCKQLSVHEFEHPQGFVVEIFGSPAVANGRVYFTTSDGTYAIGKEEWDGKKATPPAPESEPAVSPQDPVAHLQLVPAETIARPGDEVSFELRLFNARGQLLRVAGDDTAADWSLAGLRGELDAGDLTIPKLSQHQFGHLEVKVGDLSTRARVRVVPHLPLVHDFDDLEPGKLPVGWIGMSPPKFRVVDLDGERVLMKHGTHFQLKFMRARTFIGPSSMGDYTIQADLRGNAIGEGRRIKLPDMGLINQRYEMWLLGHRRETGRKLRLVSWVADRRIYENVQYPWKPDVWYTAKFSVSATADGKALVRAKVWPRGEREPSAWTISVEDPKPNLQGSPGLYAFSAGTTQDEPGTDVYFDNVVITPND